jgi:hypothetical protein
MNECATPEWIVWTLAALPVAAHMRTVLPPQAQGPVGIVIQVLDLLFANYGNCKNHVKDKQDKPIPRMETKR